VGTIACVIADEHVATHPKVQEGLLTLPSWKLPGIHSCLALLLLAHLFFL